MGRRVSPALVGAFAIGAVAIVVIAIVALGSGRLFRKTREYVMYFSGSVNGLLVGASVKMEGVPVGAVKEIRLGFNPRGEPVEEFPTKVKIAVIVELDETMLRARGVRNTDLADPQHIERAVQHGLRGVLAMESLLTGILYVDLEMLPDTPANFVQQQNDEYVEIPTIPTALEQAQVTVTQILEHLQRADFEKTLTDLNATLEALRKVYELAAVAGCGGQSRKGFCGAGRYRGEHSPPRGQHERANWPAGQEPAPDGRQGKCDFGAGAGRAGQSSSHLRSAGAARPSAQRNSNRVVQIGALDA